jgi:hypothetical protein
VQLASSSGNSSRTGFFLKINALSPAAASAGSYQKHNLKKDDPAIQPAEPGGLASGEMGLLCGEGQGSRVRKQLYIARELDHSKGKAKLNNGVLRLTIPKSGKVKLHRIT